MKIKIERSDAFHETEVIVKCGVKADAKTEKLIKRLWLYDNDVIGYKEGEAHKIFLHDVFYIDTVDEKTFLYLANGVYETKEKLYEWENDLADTAFVRVSKSTILNTDKVRSVRSLLSGKLEATLNNGEKQEINRHYVADFRHKFGI